MILGSDMVFFSFKRLDLHSAGVNGVGSILLSVRASSSWASRGREFQEEQELYKPKKDFANRMCAKPPTSAMPKPSSCVCVRQPSAI